MPTKCFLEPNTSMMHIYPVFTQDHEKKKKKKTYKELLSAEVTCEERDAHTYTYK